MMLLNVLRNLVKKYLTFLIFASKTLSVKESNRITDVVNKSEEQIIHNVECSMVRTNFKLRISFWQIFRMKLVLHYAQIRSPVENPKKEGLFLQKSMNEKNSASYSAISTNIRVLRVFVKSYEYSLLATRNWTLSLRHTTPCFWHFEGSSRPCHRRYPTKKTWFRTN